MIPSTGKYVTATFFNPVKIGQIVIGFVNGKFREMVIAGIEAP